MRRLTIFLALFSLVASAGERPLFAPQPNWRGPNPDPGLVKYYERTLRPDLKRFTSSFYRYAEDGPLGIPRVIVDVSIDYSLYPDSHGKLKVIPQSAPFATWSCTCMDFVAGQAGGWGPECKITQYLKWPKGKVKKDPAAYALEGDYIYTPRSMKKHSYVTDTARFILENGAGKKVEIVFKMVIGRGG